MSSLITSVYRTVALTGFMGAGKTTVGAALADHLGWDFVDLDALIEQRELQTIPDLFREHGENGFREIEASALAELLADPSLGLVLALGGGTFVQPANAQLLRERSVYVAFLEAPLEIMMARCCGAGTGSENLRPLAADPIAFQRLYERRLPHYRRAHLTISTEGKAAKDIARQVARALRHANAATEQSR